MQRNNSVNNNISCQNKTYRIIKALSAITVLSRSSVIVSVRLRNNTQLFSDCNFIFVSYQQISNRFDIEDRFLSYIIDVNFSIVQINNTLDQSIKIDKNSRLDSLQEYKKKEYYIAVSEYFYLAVDSDIFFEL